MMRFVSFVALITISGLLYVYEEIAAVKIGYTIRKQEEIRVQSLDRQRALKYNIASLEAPHNLEKSLEARKILLESPKQWQTLVMGQGRGVQKGAVASQALQQPPSVLKFFVGTAQAEAKESSSR